MGLSLPYIANTALLAKVGPMDFYSTSGSPLVITLFGNDQITPAGTYYTIEVLDGEDNVVQCGAYVLTGERKRRPAAADRSAAGAAAGRPGNEPAFGDRARNRLYTASAGMGRRDYRDLVPRNVLSGARKLESSRPRRSP